MPIKKWFLFIICSVFSGNLFAHVESCNELSVPIKFDSHGLPILELSINNMTHDVLLDLGSSDGIHLPAEILRRIPEAAYTGESVKSSNILGEVFDSQTFVIKSLKVNCATFSNVQGLELVPWAASIGDGENEDKVDQIVIGLDFFKGKKITINYKNKTLTIEDAEEKVVSTNDNTAAMPYQRSKEGISINVESPYSNYQMVLDTGASSSIFVASKVSQKESVKTCDYNLGPDVKCKMYDSFLKVQGHEFQPNILLFPIDERFKKDGILGSDFFNKFMIEIDFLNKGIAITPLKMKAT